MYKIAIYNTWEVLTTIYKRLWWIILFQVHGIDILDFCYLKMCKIESHSVFNLHLSDHKCDWIPLHIFTNHIYYLFCKVLSHVFFIFYIGLFVIFTLICRSSLCFFIGCMYCKYLPLVWNLYFQFLQSGFWFRDFFILMQSHLSIFCFINGNFCLT